MGLSFEFVRPHIVKFKNEKKRKKERKKERWKQYIPNREHPVKS